MVHLYLPVQYQFLQIKNMYLGINFCKMKYSLEIKCVAAPLLEA